MNSRISTCPKLLAKRSHKPLAEQDATLARLARFFADASPLDAVLAADYGLALMAREALADVRNIRGKIDAQASRSSDSPARGVPSTILPPAPHGG